MFLQITKNTIINADHIIFVEKTYRETYRGDKVAYFTEFTLINDVFHQVRHKTDEEQDNYFNKIMIILGNENA